jgi:antitoxin (DNA-binding transcriptional repressor) of toxin-antitoxin stability system
MKSVNVKELKSSLSRYLDAAKAGEEILIREGNETVARLVPPIDYDEELTVLAAQGRIKLGEGDLDEEFWKLPVPRVKGKTAQQIIDDERNED